MKDKEIPVVFCHYGDSPYLRYVFEMVRFSNPEKKIYLLGDKENFATARRHGVHHYFFEDFEGGSDLLQFDSVYREIKGENHNHVRGRGDWLNFVFRRWFYVSEFIHSENIGSFWHFDSDNMIVESLSPHESRFSKYDCTEQCNGMCMNGYISSKAIVRGYVRFINSLFSDEKFLERQKREFSEKSPDFAFTEMRAYHEFKKVSNLRTVRLGTVFEDSFFDDAVTQKHGMVMDSVPGIGQIKRVHLVSGGNFFCQREKDMRMIKVHSFNLSWVPIDVFKIVLEHSRRGSKGVFHVLGFRSRSRSLGDIFARIYRRNHWRDRFRRAISGLCRKVFAVFRGR